MLMRIFFVFFCFKISFFSINPIKTFFFDMQSINKLCQKKTFGIKTRKFFIFIYKFFFFKYKSSKLTLHNFLKIIM